MSLPLQNKSIADVDAFVLAGGRSSRMGEDKALIQLAGRPLIQHAIGILRGAGLNPQIAGAGSDLSSFAPVVPDHPQHSSLGPLSGICSALSASRAQYSVFLPVDLPLIPAGLISYLIHHASITEPAVALVSVAGFIHTFPTVISRVIVPALEGSLRSEDRKCLTAFQMAAENVGRRFTVLPIELLLQAGQIGQPAGISPSEWFLNINTATDLARAESLHAAGFSSMS